VPKPDWKQTAQTLLPLLIAAGFVTGVGFLPHTVNAPGDYANLLASLGMNLAATGLSALCNVRRLWAQRDYREALANHNIRQMIKIAWGEAALAALKDYCHTHPVGPPSIVTVSASAKFHRAVAKLKPADFVRVEPSVATIQDALAESRRALLGEVPSDAPAPKAEDAGPSEETKQRHVSDLTTALVDSVLDTVASRLGDEPPPADLRDFLIGNNKGASGESLLGHLCDYVAFYLKTNPRAQTAVLHFTLQEISDTVETGFAEQREAFAKQKRRLAALLRAFRASQNAAQRQLIESFEAAQKRSNERLKRYIDEAFNEHVQLRLDPPFVSEDGSADFLFTFKRRRTAMRGRDAAMEALVQFMGDPRPGCWTVISGPAGSGKSRLAAELIARVRDSNELYDSGVPAWQWRAGFLRKDTNWPKSDTSNWKPDADTLIVVDYAGEIEARPLQISWPICRNR